MKNVLIILSSLLLQACSQSVHKTLPQANNVDLNRFMGDWYVIANVPTFLEEGAHNAIESYAMNDDGSVATTFQFNQDAFDGELKVYKPTGFVSKENNSVWGMRFLWPFKAEYIIAYLSEDYQHTIIARSARDYVWVMARTPVVTESAYQALVKRCVDMGYPLSKIQKVPHQSQKMGIKMEGMK